MGSFFLLGKIKKSSILTDFEKSLFVEVITGKRKYKNLEEYEKFLIKDFVRVYRQNKHVWENEISVELENRVFKNDGNKKKRTTNQNDLD